MAPAQVADGADRLREILAQRGNGSLLRGWRRELDTDGSLDVGFQEFCTAASRLGVSVDAEAMFGAGSPDSLSLVGLAPAEGQLVERFRRWMTGTFGGPGEMFMAFEGRPEQGSDGKLPMQAFVDGCQARGFYGTEEEISQILELLDMDESGLVAMQDVMFLETDRRRREGAIQKGKLKHKRERQALLQKVYKEDFCREVSRNHRRAPRAWQVAAVERLPALVQERKFHWRRKKQERVREAGNIFDAHVRAKYGNGVRAWRQGLDPNSKFTLDKVEFGSYCRKVNFDADVGDLWRSLDQDRDGRLHLEEVGTGHAAVLARFQAWAKQQFGSCTASWEKLSRVHPRPCCWKSDKAMKGSTFLKALQAWGWPRPRKTFGPQEVDIVGRQLCAALDLHGCGIVSVQDLVWLDKWAAPEYLAAEPDQQAWRELRASMLRFCAGKPLRAWREFLDSNDQNRASWTDFKSACKTVGFTGNVGGAWRYLDADSSGSISLQEYDRESAELLGSFKELIDYNFGCVQFAFKSMDTDGSGSISFSELNRACRVLGWPGNVRTIFDFLDIDVSPGKRTLSFKELAFLDNWAPEDNSADDLKNDDSSRDTCGRAVTPHFARPLDKNLKHLALLSQVSTQAPSLTGSFDTVSQKNVSMVYGVKKCSSLPTLGND